VAPRLELHGVGPQPTRHNDMCSVPGFIKDAFFGSQSLRNNSSVGGSAKALFSDSNYLPSCSSVHVYNFQFSAVFFKVVLEQLFHLCVFVVCHACVVSWLFFFFERNKLAYWMNSKWRTFQTKESGSFCKCRLSPVSFFPSGFGGYTFY
jgi:hypothetical protein